MREKLPAELERRIEALERESNPQDFDGRGWLWLALLGIVLPVLLLIVGWQL
jgi:hypothetical protein